MKKLLLPLVFGSVALPVTALEKQVVEAWEESLNLPEISADVFDSYNMSANNARNARNERQRRRRNNPWLYKNGPKRTRIFSGIELSDNTYENRVRRSEFKKVLFDGNTKFHPNWRIRYAMNESNVSRGENGELIDAPTRWMKLAPRFEQVLSPTANWFAEFEYTNFSGFGRSNQGGRLNNTDTYIIKVGGNKRFGNHNFNAHVDYRYREQSFYIDDGSEIDETNNYETQDPRYQVGYRYRLNRHVQFQLTRNQNKNHLGQTNLNQFGKVTLSHSLFNGFRSEFSFQRNKNYNKDTDTGYFINRYNFVNTYRINETMQALLEVSYRKYDRFYTGNLRGAGDRKQLFTKAGINFHF
ncbi:hypothetical protein [Endozoicomonas lisbonensis]|uniref:Porin n=1 Tax=Endozoicomonas lisbonensis TaxID=3120522 RepID=A0ABV2SB55_9GAMM